MRRNGSRWLPRISPALAVLLLAAAPALAEDSHGKAATLRGEIVDLACYVGHEGKGADHALCAKKCLKMGQPMGLLSADGTLTLLFADHADATAYNKAKDLAAKQVEVKGDLADRGGIKGLTVREVKAL